MPVHNRKLLKADPFVLSKSEVIQAVKSYLKREGYTTRNHEERNGIDLVAENEYHTLLIEAQGNHLEHHEYETVNTSGHLETHFSVQIVRLMRNYENNSGKTLVMANPDTPSMREKVSSLKDALDDLEVVQFWVKEDGSIEWN